MAALGGALALVFITCANWAFSRKVMYPPVILGFCWALTLLLYSSHQGDYLYPLEFPTVAMIVLGVGCFSAGSFIAYARRKSRVLNSQTPSDSDVPRPHPGSASWMIWLSVLGFPVFLAKLISLGSGGPTESFAINVRLAISDPSKSNPLGFAAYLVSLSVFSAGLHVLGIVRAKRFATAVVFVTAATYALLSTGRTALLLLLALVLGGLASSGRVRAWTAAAVGGGTFLLLFGVGAYLLNKGISSGGPIGRQYVSVVTEYLLGGTAALNDYLRDPVRATWGRNAFRTVFALLASLGLGSHPGSLVMEFRRVPFETNVYTVFRPYYEDFGWPGVATLELLIGFLHGLAYAKASNGSRSYAYLYGMMLYPLVMQVFQDQYFSLLSTWLQGLLLLAIVSGRFTRRGIVSRVGSRARAA